MRCADDTGKLFLDNVVVQQSGDYAFSKGSFSISNVVDWGGSFTFVYDSTQSSTINSRSALRIQDGLALSIGRKSDGAIDPLTFVDKTSVLSIDNATLDVNIHGMQFLKGTFEISNNAIMSSNSTSTATAFIIGDGVLANDMYFTLNAASVLDFNKGLFVKKDSNLQFLNAKVGGAEWIRGSANTILFEQSQVDSNIILNRKPGSAIIIPPGITVLRENVTIVDTQGSYVLTGFVDSYGQNTLIGNQSLNLLSGVYSAITLVKNAGNLIDGSGNFGGLIILQDSNAQLLWNLTGQIFANIELNGGSISLANDMVFGNDIKFTGSGTIFLNNRNMFLSQTDIAMTDTLYFDGGSFGKVLMNSNVVLDSRWTFSGICSFDGGGHILDVSLGEIIVEKGSTLTFNNVKISGAQASNIRCLDNASSLVLDGVSFELDADYTFTQGSLQFKDFVEFQGKHIFAYQSTQTSLIHDDTNVSMDDGFTFSYDPGTYPDLIQFEESRSSRLIINGATIHATTQGMSLINGSMQILFSGFFESELVDSVDNGITFGDCNAAHDFVVTIAGGSEITLTSGTLNYKNVNVSSWFMQSQFSSMNIGANTLNLYQDMTNGTAIAYFAPGSTLGTSPGKTLNGSVSGGGPTNFVTLSPC